MTDFDALLEQFSSLSSVDLFSRNIFYVLVLIMRAQDFTIQWKDTILIGTRYFVWTERDSFKPEVVCRRQKFIFSYASHFAEKNVYDESWLAVLWHRHVIETTWILAACHIIYSSFALYNWMRWRYTFLFIGNDANCAWKKRRKFHQTYWIALNAAPAFSLYE